MCYFRQSYEDVVSLSVKGRRNKGETVLNTGIRNSLKSGNGWFKKSQKISGYSLDYLKKHRNYIQHLNAPGFYKFCLVLFLSSHQSFLLPT
jgi:hypothetical protein